MNNINSFTQFNIYQLQDQISSNQSVDHITSNTPQNNTIYPTINSSINMENVGNINNLKQNSYFNQHKLKQSQNTTILIAKQSKIQQSQTLAIFQRIHMKIISSYLNQISYQHRKSSKKIIYFDKSDLYLNLQLQSSFITINDIINRTELEFSEKCQLFNFIDIYKQISSFLSNTLSNGYEEINNQFIYFMFDLIQELKSFILKNQQPLSQQETTSSSTNIDAIQIKSKDKQEFISIADQQNSMKKQLQQNSFFQKVFYQKRIKYLNCQQVITPVSDQKVKQAFIRFARLYSHLIIKLIVIDFQTISSKNQIKSNKKIKSSQDLKAQNKKQRYIQNKNKVSCEILGSWFLSNSCAKSFNSINSLGSINLNNLNDIKIYNSKPDLWSQGDQQYCNDFSDGQFQIKRKSKF